MSQIPEEPANMAEAIAQAQALANMGVSTPLLTPAAPVAAPVAVPVAQQPAPAVESNDFSSRAPKTPISFHLDGDDFLARPRIGGGVVLGLAKVAGGEDINSNVDLIRTFLRQVLLPASYTLFIARLDGLDWVDPATGATRAELEPIELPQVLQVFQFLVKKYTNGIEEGANEAGFPTQAPSASAGG